MQYVIRYQKTLEGDWKTLDGIYYSRESTKEDVERLENKGYRVQIIKR